MAALQEGTISTGKGRLGLDGRGGREYGGGVGESWDGKKICRRELVQGFSWKEIGSSLHTLVDGTKGKDVGAFIKYGLELGSCWIKDLFVFAFCQLKTRRLNKHRLVIELAFEKLESWLLRK